jgi:amidase
MVAGDHFLVRFDDAGRSAPGEPSTAATAAVKDLVDVAGSVTTAGCRAVAMSAQQAEADAACLAGFRAAGVRLVGKTALNELAYGVNGENEWYGTPVNPLDPALMPGGSSSGSAVAVAVGDALMAIGTDTGGSIRIPAACCGVTGLKTTLGLIPVAGVRPLAPSFDTVGPLARDVSGVAEAFDLLAGRVGGVEGAARGGDPVSPGRVVTRLVGIPDVDADIDEAVDAALGAAGFEIVEAEIPTWRAAFDAHRVILGAEAWQTNGYLIDGLFSDPEGVGADVREKLERGRAIRPESVAAAREVADDFRRELASLLEGSVALALPSIPCLPPIVGEAWARLVWLTAPINLVGLPALSMPVPRRGAALPASIQLVGSAGGESGLLALGRVIEAAVSGASEPANEM